MANSGIGTSEEHAPVTARLWAEQDAELVRAVLYQFVDPIQVVEFQRHYVRFFSEAHCRRVLDIGSGRGIFLGLVREAGMEPFGVDSNPDAVEECRRDGLQNVVVADAREYLAGAVDRGETFDGIFCSHLLEHLPGPEAVSLIRMAAAALSPNGRLVLVTPNVANLDVWTRIFWLDPTHVRPYQRPLLEALMQRSGLEVVASFDDRRTRRRIGGWGGLLRMPIDALRLGLSIFSGMNSVVVGHRRG